MDKTSEPAAKFDGYADEYGSLLEDSIRASGESAEYFHEYKLGCLGRLGVSPGTPILDYGCGVGSLAEVLARTFPALEGYDPSPKSLETARRRMPGRVFHEDPSAIRDDHFGAAVLSGVLHHVAPGERAAVLATVRQKLMPGGKIVVFEHNPWNPLTRRAVEACPFDDDAILLWPRELRRRLSQARFTNVSQDYIVFFPRALAALRPLERHLTWLFLGAQTMTVGSRA
ncbi:MAG TPA: class I SAM-dependent methyltransferase [Polyangiaceae bacterium]|nr:class I SAM-dependent methyltransferase [Polyangiaceae bacterium]